MPLGKLNALHCNALRDLKLLTSLLVEVYPTHQWNIKRLPRDCGPVKSPQLQLYNAVRELLPEEGKLKVLSHTNADCTEYFIHPNLFYSQLSNKNMQLDVYISRLKLAFESQVTNYFSIVHSFS